MSSNTEAGHTKANGNATLAIASLAAMATYLDSSVLFVAFPDITNSFSNATTATLSWVLTAYTITFAALLVPAGKLGDRLGPRRALYIGSCLLYTSPRPRDRQTARMPSSA